MPNVETAARRSITNTTPTEAYRGAGRPEATVSVERAIDLFAAEIGMDPVELRRKNFISRASLHDTGLGTVYDSGEYDQALDLALEAAGIDESAGRAGQAPRGG